MSTLAAPTGTVSAAGALEPVADIEARIDQDVELPEGYFVALGGQFEAQQEATRRIVWLSVVALAVVAVGVASWSLIRPEAPTAPPTTKRFTAF